MGGSLRSSVGRSSGRGVQEARADEAMGPTTHLLCPAPPLNHNQGCNHWLLERGWGWERDWVARRRHAQGTHTRECVDVMGQGQRGGGGVTHVGVQGKRENRARGQHKKHRHTRGTTPAPQGSPG